MSAEKQLILLIICGIFTICEYRLCTNKKERKDSMNEQKNTYSTLIVSAADSFTSALLPILPKDTFSSTDTVISINAAKRMVSEKSYDFLVLNFPAYDDSGVRFAIEAGSRHGCIVLLMVKSELFDEINTKVSKYGIFTLARPTSKSTMMLALSWLISAKEKIRSLEQKNACAEDKVKEVRVINRAKWLLIIQEHMSEEQAHHYIEKQAMDKCVSKRLIAEEIISKYN